MQKIIFSILISVFMVSSCAPSRISEDPNSNSVGLLMNVLGPSIAAADRERIKNSVVSMPIGLLQTGQIGIFQTGDDGTYQKGITRTFTVAGTTGLLWQRCSAGQNSDATCSGSPRSYTWSQANSYCSTLNLGGITWRLPTITELKSLIDYGRSSFPTINSTAFPNTQSFYYWSSSTYAQSTSYAWGVNFYNGFVNSYYKANVDFYVRCVTGP